MRPSRMSRAVWFALIAAGLTGCKLPATAGPAPMTKRPGAELGTGAGLIGQAGTNLIGQAGTNVIGLSGAAIKGVANAPLVTAAAAGLIGQAGTNLSGAVQAPASLIGQAGTNLIGQAGTNVIAAGGGNVIASGGLNYRVAALAQPPLAGARVYVRTASGAFVAGADGKPMVATTDGQGQFVFAGLKATRNLVLFVALGEGGGEVEALQAVLPKAAAAPVAVEVASTLTTTYVLDQFVAGQADPQATFDRLPSTLEAEARSAAAIAIGEALPAELKGLSAKAIVPAVGVLRQRDTAFDSKLEEVRHVLVLAGVDATQAGRTAAQVALGPVGALAYDAQGRLYVLEGFTGVLHRFGLDGKDTLLTGPGTPVGEAVIGGLRGMLLAPDGGIYLAQASAGKIWRLAPDGKTLSSVAGGGSFTPGAGGAAASQVMLTGPRALVLAPDGTLYIGEGPSDLRKMGRLLARDPQGLVRELKVDFAIDKAAGGLGRNIVAMAPGPDGALWIAESQAGEVVLRQADGTTRSFDIGWKFEEGASLVAVEDGVIVSLDVGHQLVKLGLDGKRTVLAGTGVAGESEDGAKAVEAKLNQPTMLARAADGTLAYCEAGLGLVRALLPDGTLKTLVGSRGGSTQGDALAVSLGLPGGIGVDPKGRLVVVDTGGETLKRLENGKLVTIAGSSRGRGGDGGPATSAQFDHPVNFVYLGEDLYISDAGNRLIRKVDAAGTVSTAVGGGPEPMLNDQSALPEEIALPDCYGMAASPDGALYFTGRDRIFRWKPGGKVELVAGAGQTGQELVEGVEATAVKLMQPTGLAFDASGTLYVADPGHMRLFKIVAGKIKLVAGRGIFGTMQRLVSGEAQKEAEIAVGEATLVAPSAIAFDAAGNLYVAEAGTRSLGALLGTLSMPIPPEMVPSVDGRIRKISPDGKATVLAGLGGPASAGTVITPTGLTLMPNGKVVFVDTGTHQIKGL